MNRTLFRSALALFLVLGVVGPLIYVTVGRSAEDFYRTAVYLVGACVFWLWLRSDARTRNIPSSWAVLVGVGWLPFSVVAASLYLLFTRGVRAGSIAVLALVAIVLQFFAALAVGAIVSVGVINVLGVR